MKGSNHALIIGAMAALAAAGASAPTAVRAGQEPPALMMRRGSGNKLLDLLTGMGPLYHGGLSRPTYIKRPFHTVAQEKRRARKARNVRRHRLTMKRRGSR